MKKLLTVLLLVLMPLMAAAQVSYGRLAPLHVEGNQLKDIHGNTVVLHGVMDTPSPYFNDYRWCGWNDQYNHINDCINYFDKLFAGLTNHEDGAYCNVFRLHMDPCWTGGNTLAQGFTKSGDKVYDPHGNEVGGEANVGYFDKTKYNTYLKSVYWKIAQKALSHGLYVVVRPPGVVPGYVEVGDYYNQYLMDVWDIFSKNDSILKYSGQISIELANEPVTLRNAQGQSDPKALHDFFQPIVDKIRANGYTGIIYAPGTGWQSNYRDYAQYPIEGANIGYAVHDYVGWYDTSDSNYDPQNSIKKFHESVPVVDTNPIIITEVDWSPYKPGSGHYNEHGEWVESNYGTWATGSTSKWGSAYKAVLDHFGNISMTLSGTHCFLDIDHLLETGESVPAFGGLEEACGKACFDWYAEYAKQDYATPSFTRAWTADLGNNKYVNPIMNGDFPDCDVIRVGDTYYFVSTTMYIFPGCTMMKSKDLVNWEYCANPLLQIADNDAYNLLNGKDHYSQGQWAASLNYHDGKFYIYFICYGRNGVDETKNIMLTATDPEGTWKMEYWPDHYYDAGWLFDDGPNGDGNVYVACGIGDIYVCKLDPRTLRKVSDKRVLSLGNGLEGCHMYHIGDYYYIYATYGGTEQSQTIFRSRTPMGEYEECKTAVTDQNPNGRIFAGQKIHQGGLVQTQTGEWWTIMFKDAGAIGRVPYLEPVEWVDGWPVIGKNGIDVSKNAKAYRKPNVGQSYPRTYLPTNDTFTELTLGKQWGWNHNPVNTAWSLIERPGYLRLHTANVATELNRARNSLTQRILGYNAEGSLTTKRTHSMGTVKMIVAEMKEGDVAGLSVFQDPYSYIGVTMREGVRRLVYYHSNYESNGTEIQPAEQLGDALESDTIYLRAKVNFTTNKVDYLYSYDNQTWKPFGNGMDMRYTLRYFVGQRFFLFNYATMALGGYVDIDWFSTEPEFSEEMFYAPGTLRSFTVEDATAASLTLSQTDFTLMPGNEAEFSITCTMQSGLQSTVTTGCTYTSSNPAVATVDGGKIITSEEGEAVITATYVDLAGNSISTEITVRVSMFPLAVGAFDPQLIGSTGTFKRSSNGEYAIFRPATKGFGGWHYDQGLDLRQRGRFIVARLATTSAAKPTIRLYDVDDLASDRYFEQPFGTAKEVIIDLDEVAAAGFDVTNIYYVGFGASLSSNINISDLFMSNDGQNPTAIETIDAPQTLSEVSVEIFTMDGRKHNALQRGINIVRRTYADGTVKVAKIMN